MFQARMEGADPAVFDLNVYGTQGGRTQAVFGETMVLRKGDDRYAVCKARLEQAGWKLTGPWIQLGNGDLAASVEHA